MSDLKALLQQALPPSTGTPKLSEITDWHILDRIWGDAPDSMTSVIETRMKELFSNIHDWNVLFDMWADSLHCGAQKLIEQRMQDLA